MGLSEDIAFAAKRLKSARRAVALTGAGISTESGLPDFRSAERAAAGFRPELIATQNALYFKYGEFHAHYAKRVIEAESALPNAGHKALARFEATGLIKAVATQNTDGLHQRAGSEQVLELHGTLRSFRCEFCEQSVTKDAFLEKKPCQICGGAFLRPNVVLFDEELPDNELKETIRLVSDCDLLLVVGTSLKASPAKLFPSYAPGAVVLINEEEPQNPRLFDAFLKGKAGEILGQMEKLIFSN